MILKASDLSHDSISKNGSRIHRIIHAVTGKAIYRGSSRNLIPFLALKLLEIAKTQEAEIDILKKEIATIKAQPKHSKKVEVLSEDTETSEEETVVSPDMLNDKELRDLARKINVWNRGMTREEMLIAVKA